MKYLKKMLKSKQILKKLMILYKNHRQKPMQFNQKTVQIIKIFLNKQKEISYNNRNKKYNCLNKNKIKN